MHAKHDSHIPLCGLLQNAIMTYLRPIPLVSVVREVILVLHAPERDQQVYLVWYPSFQTQRGFPNLTTPLLGLLLVPPKSIRPVLLAQGPEEHESLGAASAIQSIETHQGSSQ